MYHLIQFTLKYLRANISEISRIVVLKLFGLCAPLYSYKLLGTRKILCLQGYIFWYLPLLETKTEKIVKCVFIYSVIINQLYFSISNFLKMKNNDFPQPPQISKTSGIILHLCKSLMSGLIENRWVLICFCIQSVVISRMEPLENFSVHS